MSLVERQLRVFGTWTGRQTVLGTDFSQDICTDVGVGGESREGVRRRDLERRTDTGLLCVIDTTIPFWLFIWVLNHKVFLYIKKKN